MGDDVKRIERLRELLVSLGVSRGSVPSSPSADLFAHGALDSLALIQFILALEQELGIRIRNRDVNFENFRSFDAIAALLASKYGQKASAGE